MSVVVIRLPRGRPPNRRSDLPRRWLTDAVAIGALLGSLAGNAQAGEAACSGDFSADRPGLSTDTAIIPVGCQQLEAGYQYSRDDAAITTTTFPLLLYRAAINDSLELRAGWDGENLTHGQNTVERSTNDPSIGAKVRVRDRAGLSISLLGQLSVPLGSAAATSGAVDPSVALLWKRTLSERTALSGAFTRAASSTGDAGRSWQSAIAVDLTRDLGHAFGVFVELATSTQHGERAMQTVDGGVTWQASPTMQLDFNAGRTWQGSRDNFIGGGIAVRY